MKGFTILPEVPAPCSPMNKIWALGNLPILMTNCRDSAGRLPTYVHPAPPHWVTASLGPASHHAGSHILPINSHSQLSSLIFSIDLFQERSQSAVQSSYTGATWSCSRRGTILGVDAKNCSQSRLVPASGMAAHGLCIV